MGKRGKARETSQASSSSGFHTSLSIREEASGKKQSHNTKSILKHKHFQNLAQWTAQQGESVGSLGAFFGRRFAEFGEFSGIPPDPSLFSCQSCETILQPGFNCTIRIEKNRAKNRSRTKIKTPTQNNVVYACHFCTHRNLKRGTPKGYVKSLTPSKAISSKPKSVNSAKKSNFSNVKFDKANEVNASNVKIGKANEVNSSNIKTDKANEANFSSVKNDKADEAPSSAVSNICFAAEIPASALTESGAKLLDSKRRKRKKLDLKGSAEEISVSSAPAAVEKGGGTVKKRKNSWTTLKDIAENEKHDRNQRFTNFSIPFNL